MKKKLALALSLVMLFALALAGCGGDNNTAVSNAGASDAGTSNASSSDNGGTSSGETIKIGHIVDLTGPETLTGEEAVRSMNFALEQMGFEMAGHPVKIITYNAASNSDTAVSFARKLVEEDGVAAILGPTQLGHKAAVAKYISDNNIGIPVIFYNATSSTMAEDIDSIFSAGGSTEQMGSAMATYLYEELDYRTINTLALDSAGGVQYMTPLIDTFTALGGTVASQQTVATGTFDYSPYLGSLPDADALISWVSGSDAINLWTAWFAMGIHEKMPMHAAYHGGFTDYFICDELNKTSPDVVKAMLESGVYAPITYAYSLDSAENQAFVDAWTQEFGLAPKGSNLPGATYSALQLLAEAIEANGGSTDPESLCKAIQQIEITSPEGHLYFTDDSRTAGKDVHIVKLVELEDGTFNYEIQKTYSDVPAAGLTS